MPKDKNKKRLLGLESVVSKSGWAKNRGDMNIPKWKRDLPKKYKSLKDYMEYMREKRKLKD